MSGAIIGILARLIGLAYLSISMDPNTSAVERAFQLAKAGQCASINDIMRKLKSEGYPVERLVGSSLIKQLKAMISASRR